MTSTPATTPLPTLYHRGKKGSIYSWTIWTEGADIVTEYGQIEGKKQLARKTATPKNVGRSNATSAEEQAVLEAQSMWQKKRDRKYFETISEAEEELVRPMLALDFEKRKNKNVTYPLDIQPKLDGVRALAYWDGEKVEILSRSGKSWRALGTIEHIAAPLEAGLLPKDRMFDGEIYAHGPSFQATTRLVKKYRPGESEKLVFHVYDIVLRDAMSTPWRERRTHLSTLEKNLDTLASQTGSPLPIGVVPFATATSEEETYEQQMAFVEDGYEGAVARLLDGTYEFGARSHDLLKIKTFLDKEFRIIGLDTGVGKFEGAAIFECETEDGKPFRVTPKGTMEERRRMYDEGAAYVGQWLKVRFFERSEDGIPRFPVGLGVRAPEDMS